jgi:hypothetical protein
MVLKVSEFWFLMLLSHVIDKKYLDYSKDSNTVSLMDEEQAALNDSFGWPMLQVDTLRECINICEALGGRYC